MQWEVPKNQNRILEGKINTNFQEDKYSEEGFQYICLSLISTDSALRTGKNDYSQVFLEEC